MFVLLYKYIFLSLLILYIYILLHIMYVYLYIYIFLNTCTSIVHHVCICMFFFNIYNIMGSCLKLNIIIIYFTICIKMIANNKQL